MNNSYRIPLPKNFNLGLCLDCGQAFRWSILEKNIWHGVAFGKYLQIEQTDTELVFLNSSEEDFNNIWKSYFDFDSDYDSILKSYTDKHLITAINEFDGIRILRQEPWEALCSFIISQNNNIPRIKGIIERLCDSFGDGDEGRKSFPSAEVISELSVDDLSPIRAGFRAKYIIDAAQKVANGEIDFNKIYENPIEFGREELQKIKGVGAKVAECTLLYGFHKIEAFPVDVWVKRIMAEMYPDGLPECTKGTEGIAQQYLFHWRRMNDK